MLGINRTSAAPNAQAAHSTAVLWGRTPSEPPARGRRAGSTIRLGIRRCSMSIAARITSTPAVNPATTARRPQPAAEMPARRPWRRSAARMPAAAGAGPGPRRGGRWSRHRRQDADVAHRAASAGGGEAERPGPGHRAALSGQPRGAARAPGSRSAVRQEASSSTRRSPTSTPRRARSPPASSSTACAPRCAAARHGRSRRPPAARRGPDRGTARRWEAHERGVNRGCGTQQDPAAARERAPAHQAAHPQQRAVGERHALADDGVARAVDDRHGAGHDREVSAHAARAVLDLRLGRTSRCSR